MALSPKDISKIHATGTAKYNKLYIGANGDTYIGTKEGRLKLQTSANQIPFTPSINIPVNTTQEAIDYLQQNGEELSQDAVGNIVIDSVDIDFTYDDTIPSITGILTVTGVTAGTYGNATNIPQIVVDAKGRITSLTNISITIPAGTVTSVAALTLGTTGTDLSSTVATSTTTPVITLNVPTASAANRGALSSTDWSTFNAKAPIASPTFTGTVTTPAIIVSSETASRVAIIDASKNVKSADTTTYPSLTELSYIKGVTSAVQTQLDSIYDSILIPIRLNLEPLTWTDSTTYYQGLGAFTPTTVATRHDFNIGYNLILVSVIICVSSSNTPSNEDCTLQLRNVTQGTSSSIGTFKIDTATTVDSVTTFTGLNISIASTDHICAQIDTAGFATNPTNARGSITLFFQRA